MEYNISCFWRDGYCIMSVNGIEFAIDPWIGKQMEAWNDTPRLWRTKAINTDESDRSLNKHLKKIGEYQSMNPNKKPGSTIQGLDY